MYDVAIVGAGPAGASAATFTARAGLKTLLLDADQSMTRRAWIPNHLGFPDGVTGNDLVDLGKKQAQTAGANLVKAKVTAVRREGEGFRLETEGGEAYEARQVILCLGANCELARQAGAEIVEGPEPRIKEVVAVDREGRTRVEGLWAAGTCAGTSVHTIITAGDGARVAINLISAVKGARHVDHEVMPASK
ncbi:FAD-dependent oxidoreductase [Symbiobacterium thermophilum]|uniref:Pyridine nucleotide-disulfide oxidoreductase n=2 Tax=Symbiobacterium thermophilum TaxID=2734 RepID=A0A953IAB6_SYMTR|nr:FAD-dependent oxidoreductase [Symbiobacterium thermophilum]MBY6277353.1 pyridine nucleotide-disulfide oxidoreductase [Symbiobacterium thermophilum]BAD41498.1 putative thioredoxin reductase [Symbiobacterium thermophilum IAM 14863]